MPNPLVTANATTTTLATYTSPEGTDSFVVWDFMVTAMAGATCAAWHLRAAAKRSLGSTALVGSVETISEQKDTAASTWAVSVDVNGDAVRLRVTGAAATSITWVLHGSRQRCSGSGGIAALGGLQFWREAL